MTGRGLADPASDRAYDVVTIGSDRLQSTASGRLEDALRDVAGLQQFRRSDARSANPTSQGVTLRGLGGNAASRALVLLDGVPQGDPFAGYLNFPLYLPERIGRVRVTRGGGTGVSGSGALAGTIEFESVGADARPAASVALGSRDAVDARALLSGALGGGHAFVSLGNTRGDGFIPVVPEQAGRADIAARYRQSSVALRGVVPTGAGELQAALALFDDRRSRGTAFSTNTTRGADASVRYVGGRVIALGYLQLRRFTSEFASVDANRASATQTLDQYNTPATGIGLRGEWRPLTGATELRVGGEWRRATGETNEAFFFAGGAPTRLREAGGRSDIVGLFAEATQTSGPLTLTGGARVDRWWLGEGRLSERTIAGAPLVSRVFAARGDWQATGRAGAALAVSETLDLRGAAYLGWRLPTLNELYRPFRVGNEVTNPNAALAPERSRGIKAGLRWRPASRIQFAATAFANRLDDAIVNATLSSSASLVTRERRNADLKSNGIELDASWSTNPWSASFSYAFTDASIGSLRPAQVARHGGSATAKWRGLGVTARYIGRQFDDDQNLRPLDDALTFDAVAALPIGSGYGLTLRAENIAGARVEAARSALGVVERAAPRTIWAELRWRG